MSNSIDERVVEMKFDNAQVDRGDRTALRPQQDRLMLRASIARVRWARTKRVDDV